MKIRGQDFAQLLDMVRGSPVFPMLMDYREKGLSDRRYRWDCLWAINEKDRKEWFDRVYQFANDDHIDTALRKITQTK